MILGKKRLSVEYVMLVILEYMCLYARDTPISKYHILTKVKGLNTQRLDRITNIMNTLEKNGYVKAIKTSSSTFYQVTDKGLEVYYKWAKDFLEFVRNLKEGIVSL